MTAPTPTLQTDRFTLRPVERGDAAALFPSFSDEGVMRYWSRPPFKSEEELADWLMDKSWPGRTWVAVERAGDGPAVARFVASDEGMGTSEIGYLVCREHVRRGIARECLSALITHLFRVEGRRRIFADVDPDNTGSNRLLESLGFTREAHLRENWVTHIGVRDSYVWGLLAREWPAG